MDSAVSGSDWDGHVGFGGRASWSAQVVVVCRRSLWALFTGGKPLAADVQVLTAKRPAARLEVAHRRSARFQRLLDEPRGIAVREPPGLEFVLVQDLDLAAPGANDIEIQVDHVDRVRPHDDRRGDVDIA